MRGFASALRLWALPAYKDSRNHRYTSCMCERARTHVDRDQRLRFTSFAHVNQTRAHRGHPPHALPWCWDGVDGKFGRTSTLNPSARDEACSGTVCSVVTVEIAHMGLAECPRMVSSLKPVKVCRSGVAGMAVGPMACRRCLRLQTGN
jgi:hypothetical protein